jgi:hypothetical protein
VLASTMAWLTLKAAIQLLHGMAAGGACWELVSGKQEVPKTLCYALTVSFPCMYDFPEGRLTLLTWSTVSTSTD